MTKYILAPGEGCGALEQVNQILAGVKYQQRIREVKEGIDECTGNLQQVANLSYGKAKQNAYYTASTHKLDELDFEPILALLAGSGSGKNEVMNVLKEYAHNPRWITVSDEMSKATVRDELNSSYLGTALIEEADTVPEGLLTRRPYKVSGSLSVYKPHETAKGDAPYFPQSYNLFGATILHRRVEFRDNAVRRRALIVRWRHLDPKEMERQGFVSLKFFHDMEIFSKGHQTQVPEEHLDKMEMVNKLGVWIGQ